jgi:hypothetical protein
MDWIELLRNICEVCLIPLLGVLTAFLVQFIRTKQAELKAKTENETIQKYINMLSDTIVECVISTNQTYVNELKDKDLFDEEAQKEAFNRTFEAVFSIITEEAYAYLSEFYGDLENYVQNKIESVVWTYKKSHVE